MKALILAAGYGKRLMPLTKHTPKCLTKINKQQTIIDFWIEKINKIGIKDILINTHYLNRSVNNHIKKKKFINNIKITYEKKLLGTAGTLLRNKSFFSNQKGLLLHADNYVDINLNSLIKAHNLRPKSCTLTMLTFNSKDPKNVGIVKTDKKNRLKKYYEKCSNKPGKANGAIYVLDQKFISQINSKNFRNKDFSKDIIPIYKKKNILLSYKQIFYRYWK
ncbi:MAG: nucleotidyl transferase [Crocinitomicaceae bacterium]|nr:nucleotidyl transferase [Crocinitomicaceae bacterium]